MKKNIFFKSILMCFLVTSLVGFSQVRIGNTTGTADPSALLDVVASNKGLLLPKVALLSITDEVTIPNPATGLMVYNTTSTGNVIADQIYSWTGSTWEKFIALPKIRSLKVPIDYVILSRTPQIFTATEISTINIVGSTVPVQWSAADVILPNPTDLELSGASDFLVKTTSFYEISGSFTFAVNTEIDLAPTYIVITLQSSTNNGTTWTDLTGSALSYEIDTITPTPAPADFLKPQTITFPTYVHKFTANEKLRFVVSKPTTTGGKFAAGTGFQSRESNDNTKSVRFTRLTE